MSSEATREKEVLLLFLRKIYDGKVETQYSFKGVFPDCVRPEDFVGRQFCEALEKIWNALRGYRGYCELINQRTKRLPGCDYYIPVRSQIIEFDERQHFSIPRRIALELYPDNLELGFDRHRYLSLCEGIASVDNDRKVPHRDEQRAWLGTLRVFLPIISTGGY